MRKLFLLVAICLLFFCEISWSQTLPAGFTTSVIGSGWNLPMGTAFSTNGQKLFVWEKDGRVYVCNRNASGNYIKQSTPVLDISEEVTNWGDHGLMGFALDPNYLSNGLIYLLYVVDRHYLMNFGTPAYNPATTSTGATIGRITRYKTITSGANLVTDPGSRMILLGETRSTGIAETHDSHGLGTLAFAADGTLLVTAGDGGSYYTVDKGSDSDTDFEQALADGILRPEENVGAFRAQMLNCHNGKLLRIDPVTGNGVSSNPYYSAAAPRSAKSRVWAFGLRNPFRFSIKPGTGSTNPAAGDVGEIYVGDVGWNTYEEVHVITTPGVNCGWPLFEGLTAVPGYTAAITANRDEPNPLFGTGGCTQQFLNFQNLIRQVTADNIKTVYNPCNPATPIGTGNRFVHHRPIIDWKHFTDSARVGIFSGNDAATAQIGSPASNVIGSPFAGNCAIGGPWYSGSSFPAEYKNRYFVADHDAKWIRCFSVDFTDVVTEVKNFGSGFLGTVNINMNPLDGTLVVVELGNFSTIGPSIKQIKFGGNQSPIVKITSDKTFGPSVLNVNFTGNTSSDPDGNIASYAWNFGDGATSTSANPSHNFTAPANTPTKYVVKLIVRDNLGASSLDSIIISVNNTPPVVNITGPVKNSLYKIGPDTLYTCSATVIDAQHSGSQLKYEWQTFLRHNNHQHPEPISNAVSPTANISRIGCNGDQYYWLIMLTVTDAAGLSATDSSKIFPDCSPGTDNTPPTVSSVSPLNSAINVATGTTVSAIFNETIDPVTVTGTTFQLKEAGNNIVPASITTSFSQITLTPSAALANSTVYTVSIKSGASGVKDLAGNALVNDYSWSFTTAAVDNTAPTVTNVSPANGAAGVSTGTTVIANFSEAINGSTVNGATIQLKDAGNNAIAAGLNTSGSQAILTPSAALAGSTVYTVTIKSGASGIKDLAGNALVNDYSWSFTTAVVDNTAPTVTTVSPVNGATGISKATTVIANFSEALNASSVTGITFQLRDAANNLIAATINTSGSQITLTPSAALAGSTVYTVTIKSGVSGVKDLAGNALVNDFIWTFTTVADVDNTPPTVSSVSPVNGATGVNIYSTVTANFNEAINASTVTGSTFQLRDAGSNLVSATVSTSSNQITLAPTALLTTSTTYTITIVSGASGVKDIAGNALLNNYSWTFTTGNETFPPPVTIHSFTTKTGTAATTHSLTGVPAGALLVLATTADAVPSDCNVSSSPSLTWTKRVDAGAANSDNAEIWTAVYSAGGSIIVTSNWGAESQASVCYVVLYSEPSLGGTFGTAVLQNAPSVTITTTRDNSIIFGCTADWNAVNGTTRTLRDAALERLYFKDGNYTTYHYTKAAASITAYTEGVSLPTGQQASTALLEIRGNADIIPPSVTSVTPVNGVTDVSVSTTVSVIFNEAMDATTINGSTIELRNASNILITATVSYNAATRTAILTPSGVLANSTVYTAKVKSGSLGVKDMAGNVLASDYSWSFTTEIVTSPPTVSIQSFTTKTGTAATAHSLTGVPAGALLVLATTADAVPSDCSISSSPSLTWTKRVDAGGTNSDNAEIWTAVYSAGGSITVTSNWGGDNSQTSVCYVVLNAEPTLDGAFGTAVLQSAPSVTITTTRENSIIFGCTADWKAINGATRTLRDAATERLYFKDGNLTTYHYTKAAALIAAYTEGVSLPTGQQASTALLEIRSAGIPPGVTTQPTSQTKCAGENASFSSAASGSPATVQWQESTNGTTWTNITGATNATLSFAASIAEDNTQYRAVWTNSGGNSNTNPATLTVNPIPVSPTITIVNNCGNSVLTAGSFTGSILWSNGATIASPTVTTAGTYTVTQTVNGCTSAAGSGTAVPKPIPQLLGGLATTATSNDIFTLNTASTVAGTSFAWNRAVVTGISNAAANGTGSVSETLINTTSSPVNVTYVFTLTAGGCTNTQNVVITVYPAATGNNCTIDNTSLTSNFSSAAIPAGRYIWFNSSLDPGSLGSGTDPVTMYITNGVISFTANNVQYNLNVPNARIRFDASVTSASTQFINNVWETVVPRNYTSDVFMSGLSYLVPVNFPGNYTNVKWTANISIDKPGISLGWRWAAAVYTTFASHPGINVKPINGSSQNLYANSDRAGAPQNFKSFVVNGAKGEGRTNYTGSFSTVNTATCAVNPFPVTPACTINNTSMGSNFSATTIPAGRYIWFNSSFDPGSLGTGTDPVTIYITNGVISFTANNVQYNLNVPSARIRFDASVTSASTQFSNNVWETVVPRNYTSDVFMSGLSYLVPINFPGDYMSVNWTTNISIDKPGISLGWRWAAAAYTSFANHPSINVKPINGSTQNPYANSDRAGTPDNFKSFVVDGAKGTGGTNYTGSFSTINTATCSSNTGQRSSQQAVVRQIPVISFEELVNGKLKIEAMPNPSNTYFNLVIKSNNNNPATIKVTDIFGRVVERHEKISANTVLQIGRKLKAGSYFVEVIQSDQRRFLKVIKVN